MPQFKFLGISTFKINIRIPKAFKYFLIVELTDQMKTTYRTTLTSAKLKQF